MISRAMKPHTNEHTVRWYTNTKGRPAISERVGPQGLLEINLQANILNEFVPSSSGAYKFANLNPRYFNKFGCDDGFDRIENKTATDLADEISKALEKLKNAKAEALGRNERSTERSERQCHVQKRPVPQPLTPIFT